MDSKIGYEYLCSAERNGKVVDVSFIHNRYSVLEYKNEQEKNGNKVNVSAISEMRGDIFSKQKIFRKCDTSKLKFPERKGWSVRVLCIETGVIYETIRACQKATGMGNWVVRKVVYEGREFNGRRYKIIDEESK